MRKLLQTVFVLLMATVATNAQVVINQTPKGAQYQIFTHNAGPKIKLDDIITFHVVQKTERDSVIFSSYNVGHPVQIRVQASQNVADLMEVFPFMANKDSALIKIPADSVFKGHEQNRPLFLPAKSNILYVIKIEKVQSINEAIAERNAELQKMQQAELANANNYITANKIPAISLPSGLKYVITKQGTGRRAVTGDTLLVNYTGRTLSGKVFDTSIQADAVAAGLQQPGRDYQPIRVVLGLNQVISGWETGLRMLNQGAKAMFIIPSNLAYGSQGAGQDIGPFSTLLFDIEVLKLSSGPLFKPASPAAAAETVKPAPAAPTPPVKKPVVKKKKSHS